MRQLLVGATVMNRAKQRLLLVVVLRQQIAVGSREEGALVDAMLFAVGFHLIHVNHHLPRKLGLTACFFPFGKYVAQQRTIHVATVKVIRIPFLVDLEVSRLAPGIFRRCHLSHRFFLRLKRFSSVGLLDVG